MAPVPVRLGFEQHVEVVRAAGQRLVEQVDEIDLGAAVPTCPRWSVADLLAHQTTVHRWAAAHLGAGDPDAVPSKSDLIASVPDLRAHYREGLDLLLDALRAAPPDLEAMTFLRDAPAPRAFWARRQAHETTVHAVDAQAARLGRAPTALEVAAEGLTPEVALDGLDELVCGFVTRGRSKVVLDAPATVHVRPTDVDEQWTLVVGDSITTTHGPVTTDDGDAVLSGTGTQLYLGLWNRGDEVVGRGRGREVLAAWRRGQRVRWS
jgi:uncharacterized protein (TIGR03083 family)